MSEKNPGHTSCSYEYEKYCCASIREVRQMLDTFGVAILPAVFDAEECESVKSGMWDYLEQITQKAARPIRRTVKSSWRTFHELSVKHSQLMQNFHVGQAQFAWNVRQNPKYAEVFAELWQVRPEDLVVSFDGASFHIPPESIGNVGWDRGVCNLHSDQSYTRNNFECIQSWMTANEVRDGDATLTVLEGSHRFHAQCAQEFSITDERDWYRINEAQVKFY